MEEKMLKQRKYNFIQKIQKRLLIRKLNKNKNFEDWKKSSLKDDPEIMEIAWDLASPEQYKDFPVGKQVEKAEYNKNNICHFSLETQLILFESNADLYGEYLSDEALQSVVKIEPNNYSLLDMKTQKKIVQQTAFLQENLTMFSPKIQKEILLKRPDMIPFSSKEVKIDVLKQRGLSSLEWQTCLGYEKDLTISKLFKYLKHCKEDDKDSNQKAIAEFCNSSKNKQEIINYIQQKGKNKENDYFFIGAQKYLDKDTELALFDELVEMYYRVNDCKPEFRFRLETMQEKFMSREYGVYYYSKYNSIINKINKLSNSNRVFNLLFREKTIVDKVEPDKVIEYIELLDKYEKQNKVILGKKPLSQKIYEKKLNKKFEDIIKDAFGEKAGNIIKNRPGINLNDIPNTEVFSPNIVENFRPGFVNDLLSYNISGLDDFIKMAQNPDEIKAFKLYYDTMSGKLGENVVTMQLCISNYPKFQDILKEASNTKLSDEQITNITNLCSWPANICNIKKLDELENLEERLENEIFKDRSLDEQAEENKKIFGETITQVDDNTSKYSDYNILRQNIEAEEIIFDYKHLQTEELSNLSDEEKSTFQFFQQQQSFDISSIQTLREAKKKGIPLSSIFINQYTSRIKIKKNQMEKFGEDVTDKGKIEKAAEQGKEGVKIQNIDGVELIDLGTMPVNFATHNPNWNQSDVSSETQKKDNYMYYDGIQGMSTISAFFQKDLMILDNGYYVYWDFKNNEIMGFKSFKENGSGDASVSHGKKLVIPHAVSNRAIKNYPKFEKGDTGEIAFYRRKRDHSKEEGMYAGKFAPDALTGITEENIIASQIRFGHSIPILVPRKSLSNPETINKYQKMIENAKEKIQQMQEEEKKQESEFDR